MPSTKLPVEPHWYFIPVRVLLITFLLTLLSFAIGLLLGIAASLIAGWLRGIHPDMTSAYRHVALPIALVVATIVLVSTTVLEIRRYRHTKGLVEIARVSG
jgi:hypothetical protein